ncbi:unnamed protein product, partial [Colletotrichum noveboracense]
PVDFDWDPKDPPLWTIRPEDRWALFDNKTAFLEKRSGDPCSSRDHHALKMYHQYFEADCKAKYHIQSDGTCEGWSDIETKCGSFCQIHSENNKWLTLVCVGTYFEWAEERPFPHSDCHAPVDESTSVGWSVSVTPKVGKLFKAGLSGGWSESWSTAYGRTWTVKLDKGQCGYFTFVPVRKVVCLLSGTLSMCVERSMSFPGPPHFKAWCDKGKDETEHQGNACIDELWLINGESGKQVPDGAIIFVYTDCRTREPLPMDKQDPIYSSPGVALDGKTIDSIQQAWVWNSCEIVNIEGSGDKKLIIRGSGFPDEKIGENGDALTRDVLKKCDVYVGMGAYLPKDVKFNFYARGKPDDSPKDRGATWQYTAIVHPNTRPGCIGEFLVDIGFPRQDRCIGEAVLREKRGVEGDVKQHSWVA